MITKNKIIKELREILRVYHYNAINGFATCGTLNMSADVVTRLENLLGKTLKGVKPCPTKKQ